jgi:hypothetical protein
MDEGQLYEIREIVKTIQGTQKQGALDYHRLTAPCGLPCFACYVFLATEHRKLQPLIGRVLGIPPEKVVCRGCRNEQGKCGLLPMPCNVYPCAEKKGITFCCDCSDFPCDYLHPYFDNAKVWHNTKVFNLCLIKKMGLESWAQNKARSVLDVYFYSPWKL